MEKKFPAFGNNFLISNYKFQIFWAILFSILIISPGWAAEPIRKAAVAGGFYPGSKADLEKTVDALLSRAPNPGIQGNIRGIIVPHAGYVFSGPVAAYAYQALQGQDIQTVILLGNSHTEGFDGISVFKKGAFETPLGLVEVDQSLAEKIIATNPAKILDKPSAHERDHILEVQLPFLQRTLKNFKIVPIVFGNDDPALTRILAEALKTTADNKTLIVASTDMSHYPPAEAAAAADHQTIQAISSGKAENLDATLQKLISEQVPGAQTFLCGVSGVRTLLLVAQDLGFSNPHFLKYANSGDSLAGDKSRVVGYSAFAFNDVKSKKQSSPPIQADESALSLSEQKELLSLARSTVENYINGKSEPPPASQTKALQKHLGAFVTLKKHGQLRGCIGRFEPDIPLFTVVSQMAISAATQDPRFQPVQRDELGSLEYEISVLSPMLKVQSADEIELGKHGVTVAKEWHHGVFLPQVATETGWSKEEFLGELCFQKADLPRDCWKDPGVQLNVFTAQVFSEEKK